MSDKNVADLGAYSYRVIQGGGGPEDPMLEARVGRLESDVAEIKLDIRDIRSTMSEIARRLSDMDGDYRERFARVEGGFDKLNAKIDALPTQWQFTVALVSSVLASGALAAAIAGMVVVFLS